jgi:tetratricopeptide (TPR) repeat protein
MTEEERIYEFNKAKKFFQKRDFSNAKQKFKEILKDNLDEYGPNYFLAKIAQEEKDLKLAETYGEKIIKSNPTNVRGWNLLIDLNLKSGNSDKAIKYAKENIRLGYHKGEMNYNLGKIFLYIKKFDNAEDFFKKSFSLNINDNKSLYGLALVNIHKENYDSAIKYLLKQLSYDKNNVNSLNAIGFCYYQKKNYIKANSYYFKSIKLNSKQPDILLSIGTIFTILESYNESIEYFKKSLKLNSKNINSYINYGRALASLNQHKNAIEIYNQGLKINKNQPLLLANIGASYLNLGEIKEAKNILNKALEIDSNKIETLVNLGNVASIEQDFYKALDFYKKALKIDKENLIILNNISKIQIDLGLLDDSYKNLKKIIKKNPTYSKAYNNISNYYYEKGNIEESIINAQKALDCIKEEKDLPEIYNNIGNCHKALGEIDKSIISYKKSLEFVNAPAEAFMQLSYLNKIQINDPIIKKMENHKNKNIALKEKATIGFGLYKVYEDNEDYERAFLNLKEANLIYNRINKPIDIKRLENDYNTKKEIYSHKTFSNYNSSGFNSNIPIFIVGMPRSGTSLLEQILSNHSKISGAGELTKISELKSKLITTRKELTSENSIRTYYNENLIKKIKADTRVELGKEYIKFLKNYLEKGKEYVTDKMPGNYVNIGFIKLILPKAKIINIERNPMDNCFSLYSLRFHRGHEFSYDLEALANNYNLYQELMEFWKQEFINDIFTVKYENLIENLEIETTKILRHCGLDFEENCINFHKNKRVVLTASNVQVRKKINNSSINRWKKYDKELSILQKNLIC